MRAFVGPNFPTQRISRMAVTRKMTAGPPHEGIGYLIAGDAIWPYLLGTRATATVTGAGALAGTAATVSPAVGAPSGAGAVGAAGTIVAPAVAAPGGAGTLVGHPHVVLDHAVDLNYPLALRIGVSNAVLRIGENVLATMRVGTTVSAVLDIGEAAGTKLRIDEPIQTTMRVEGH